MIKLVSVYDKITDVTSLSVKTIDQILTIIKNGNLQLMAQITAIRNMTSHGEQNIAKKELPVFTCNGTFYRRNNVSLLQYSSFIAIDFDGFSSYTKLQAYKEHLKTFPYVYAVFVSPSGMGLKAIVKHNNTNPAHHYNLFVQLHRVFGLGNTNFDSVVSDISRGTYFSYDPDLWLNPCCKPFEFVYDLGIGDKKEKAVTGKKPVTTTASYHYETSDADRLMNSIFQGTMTDKQVINYMNNHFWKKKKEDYEESLIQRRAVIYDSIRANIMRNDLIKEANQVMFQYEQRLKHDELYGPQGLLADAREEFQSPFFLCSSHPKSAKDHAAYQGKIYYDEAWKDYVPEADQAVIRAIIRNRKLDTIQYITGAPVFLTTRRNCKHYFINVSVDEVAHASARSLLKLHGMVMEDENPASRDKLYYREYYNRLKIEEALHKLVPNEKLAKDITRDKKLLDKWKNKL